jgi:NAD(P)-dependent dehydrogenase (short-subunit alcohol dehydrogenase family)
MHSKHVLITGATSGIGLETALELSRMGAHITLAGRSEDRCQTARKHIVGLCPGALVDFIVADFSELAQTRSLAQEYRNRHRRLDILINNAGAIFFWRRLTPDGFEATFQVNHLSPFLLTSLLLETIIKTANEVGEARIINVSSNAHYNAEIQFDDLGSQRYYRPMRVYGMSKLANILHAFELDRRLREQGITVNALHPGLVATSMGTNHNPILRLLSKVFLSPFTISAAAGAKTSVFLATSPTVKDISGAYYVRCKPVTANLSAYNEEIAQRLYQVSSQMVGIDTNS